MLNLSPSNSSEKEEVATIRWNKIEVSYGNRKILSLPEGYIRNGRVLGVLGPSGSGKSTLLNVLGRRLKNGIHRDLLKSHLKVEEDIHMTIQSENFLNLGDSKDVESYYHPIPMKSSDVAFIHQDDSFFGMLSVEETLILSKELKNLQFEKQKKYKNSAYISNTQKNEEDKDMKDESEVEELVSILSLLGLQNVAHTRVGTVSSRGISGGESKRLSVACELFGNPSMLLADEPTSGLDSFRAQQVVALLYNLSRHRNLPCISSIHQPRSSIWSLFDDILLLTAQGRVAYWGSREGILKYFRRLGYDCPVHTNPAEFLVDLVSVDTSSKEKQTTTTQTCARIADEFETYYNEKISSSSSSSSSSSGGKGFWSTFFTNQSSIQGTATVIRPSSPFPSQSSSIEAIKSHRRDLVSFSTPSKQLLPAIGSCISGLGSYFSRKLRRFSLLFLRSFRQTVRDTQTNVARMFVSALLAYIIGTVYHRPDNMTTGDEGGLGRGMFMMPNEEDISSRMNIIAQAAINVGMLAIIKTLQLFKQERHVITRELEQDLYTPSEYIVAKSLSELPLDALVAAIFGVVLHHTGRLNSDPTHFVGILSVLACTCSSLGLAIGTLFPQGDVSLAIGPSLMVVYIIVGTLGPTQRSNTEESLSLFLEPFRYLSPMRWATEGLSINEFKGYTSYSKSTWPILGFLSKIGLGISNPIIRVITHLLPKRREKYQNLVLDKLGVVYDIAFLPKTSYSYYSLMKLILLHTALSVIGVWGIA